MMAFQHISVLLQETVDALAVKPDGIYVDATLGGGGHAFEVCRHLSDKGRFIGIDQDAAAIEAASVRLSSFGDRVTVIRSNYCDIGTRLRAVGIEKVDGIVLDLGVSSYQLDAAERGFSYRLDAPLDMRMDQRQGQTAKDIVNSYSEADLYRIIRDYGEDRFAKNIAKHIVMEREKAQIETTEQLNEVIRHAIPMKIRKAGGHPSKRTFQAIRIEPGAGSACRHIGRDDRHAESRREDLYYYFPFPGRPDCKERLSETGKPLYLSKPFSSLCMWECIKGEGDHQKANPSWKGGTRA
jgi:16S rRNA (cytosine1402-N4)-methyltransferase